MVKKISNAKWLAMGIIGISLVISGVTLIIVSRFLPLTMVNSMRSQILYMILQYNIIGELSGLTLEQYLLIFIVPSIVRMQNISNFIGFVLLIIGIVISGIGGIFTTIGWTKYYELEKTV